jgi:hypothetical protein
VETCHAPTRTVVPPPHHRSPIHPPQPDLLQAVLIRYSTNSDAAALARLPALDSRKLPEGPFLLAEAEGELVAVASLAVDEDPLSDPFRPTATIRELLRLRARQVRQGEARTAVPRAKSVLGEAT